MRDYIQDIFTVLEGHDSDDDKLVQVADIIEEWVDQR